MILSRHRDGLILLLAVHLLFFASFMLRGQVIFPHDNSVEVGAPASSADGVLENRRFSDQSSVYVPELDLHLNGNHDGWISTWNPHVEMGRPTMQISSFSRAFVLTHVLSWFVADAFWLYTWLAAVGTALTGVFGYLLLRALRLHPAACLAGSLGLSLGLFPAFWLTFVMFIWGICWTVALLWLLTGYFDRPTFSRELGIAFVVHALLLTGYPQQIVWHAYICLGYTLVQVVRTPAGWRGRAAGAARLLAAVAAGVASAAPVYLDLALNAARSGRADVEASFFLAALPRIGDLGAGLLLGAGFFDPFWFGNPALPGYVIPRFPGTSLTPVFCALMMLSLAHGSARRLWPAQVFVGVCVVMTLWPAAYAFGIEYLALGLSVWVPVAAAFIPAMVLSAFGADRILRRGVSGAWLAVGLAALPAFVALAAAAQPGVEVDRGRVALGLALLVGVLLFVRTRSPVLLGLLAVATVQCYAAQVALTRPRGEIREDSRVVDWLREHMEGGGRYAWVGGNRQGLLPSNQEVLLGLRSIHTYNSLSSLAYQEWVRRVSRKGAAIHGRRFTSLFSLRRASPTDLDLWGVDVLLTRRGLSPSLGSLVASFDDGLKAYAPVRTSLQEAQLGRFQRSGENGARLLGAVDESQPLKVVRTWSRDDRLHFEVTASSQETLLVVSGQHHPQWRAVARGSELQTVSVDGFYQGVVLPPGTTEVDLLFRPFVRFAWLPQLLFALAGAVVSACWIWVRRPGQKGQGRLDSSGAHSM